MVYRISGGDHIVLEPGRITAAIAALMMLQNAGDNVGFGGKSAFCQYFRAVRGMTAHDRHFRRRQFSLNDTPKMVYRISITSCVYNFLVY